MRSLPCHFPDWREIGARPAKLAACFPFTFGKPTRLAWIDPHKRKIMRGKVGFK